MTDPVVPRPETSGTRVPRRVEQPRTLSGAAVTVALLLGALFAAMASPMLLVGVCGGAVAGFAAFQRRSSGPLWLCLQRPGGPIPAPRTVTSLTGTQFTEHFFG